MNVDQGSIVNNVQCHHESNGWHKNRHAQRVQFRDAVAQDSVGQKNNGTIVTNLLQFISTVETFRRHEFERSASRLGSLVCVSYEWMTGELQWSKKNFLLRPRESSHIEGIAK